MQRSVPFNEESTMRTPSNPVRKFGFDDPTEFGYVRLFTKFGVKSDGSHIIPADKFPQYLDALRMLMRKYLDLSEKARDSYYLLKKSYEEERGLGGFEVDAALQRDAKAQKAISDNQMYDRWATKCATVLQAEVAYATFMGWGRPS